MTKTTRFIVTLATVVAILAVTRTASAQWMEGTGGTSADSGSTGGTAPIVMPDAGEDQVTHCATPEDCTKECLEKCGTRLVICASEPTDVMKVCGTIPACAVMAQLSVDTINMTCDRCRAGDRNCTGGNGTAGQSSVNSALLESLLPWLTLPPPPAPAPKPAPAPAPAPTPLSKEQLCKQQVGIMVGTACWTLAHAKQEIGKLQSDLDALTKRVDGQGKGQGHPSKDELKKINERLNALEAAAKKSGTAPGAVPGASQRLDLTPEELQRRIDGLQSELDKQMKVTEGQSNHLGEVDRQQAQDRKDIEELQHRISGIFGFELNAAIGIHALRPYDNTIWGVMPELFWLPEFADGWRLELGGGYGYAGQLDGEALRIGTVMIGMMPRIGDVFHLGFGVTGEWRTDPSEHTKYASYGAYIEPKLCPDNDLADAQTTPPHYFCIGVRGALEATGFQHPIVAPGDPPGPHNGEVYWRPDANFEFYLGYAFLP